MVTKEQLFTGEEKYDRISLLQFRIIEFYFEKSFPPSDKYPENPCVVWLNNFKMSGGGSVDM